jgi:drug/metabolite transporter (DMT)-like permease
MNPSLPVIVLFISSVGWGLTWLPIKYLNVQGIEGPFLVLIAFTAASLCLLPVFLRQRQQWLPHLNFVLLIALFGGFANLAFQVAIYHGDVIRVMILFYLLPVWSVLGGVLFLKESIDAKRIFTVIAALLGAFLILGGFALFQQPPGWIDLLAIGSGFAFAMNNLLFRATQTIPLTSKVTAMFAGCAILIGGFFLFGTNSVSTYSTGSLWLTILYGIVWLTLITFGTQWGVTRIQAGRASIIIVMELVVAVISAAIILQQTMSLIEIVGGLLVVSAAIIEGAREDVPLNVQAESV